MTMKNAVIVRRLAGHWGRIWGVPRAFIEAIVSIESGGVPSRVNRSARAMALDGAWGLMQITGVTARDVWRQVAPVMKSQQHDMASTFEDRCACSYILRAWTGKPEALLDPELNICLGVRYMARLQKRFGPDFTLIAAAYHQGPARVQRFLKTNRKIPDQLPPFGREYVRMATAALESVLQKGSKAT